MKKITQKLMFLLLLLVVSFSYSQKVAVIGINHATPDGFTFVVTQDLASGEVIYFTENEYNDASNAFVDQTEAVVVFTASAIILKGNVVFVNETTTDTFSVSCTSGVCGTAVKTATSSNFALGTDGETLYAYSDSDSNPTNGITTIHSVMYSGFSEGPVPPNSNGGFIPVAQDPSFDYPTAIVIDGFPAVVPGRVEFTPTVPARTNVSKVVLENPSNYVHAQANAALSTIFFTNLTLVDPNPIVTVTASPTSVLENSGTGMVYTFSLSANAVSNLTINFTVGGSATFSSDYSQVGAATFTATTGTITILSGSNTASLTLTPVGDSTLEPSETAILTIVAGTGYVGGSPGASTTTINNDDTSNLDPLIAITGISHSDPDGFSFVAAQDIPANTVVYFTDNSFDNSSLLFGTGDAVLRWTSPASIITKGNVVVVTESAPDAFTLTCSNGTCGSITLISGNFAIATTGETMYAYQDSDTNPSNGVTNIYGVLFTGTSSISGGNIPSIEDPSTIFLKSIVVDGFPAVAPAKTEYDPTKRAVLVTDVDFENIANWLHAQVPPALSTVPFINISLVPPLALTSLSQTNISCNGGSNGAASVNPATGGTAPYTYNWTPGSPTGDGTVSVTGLSVGLWACTVTDNVGSTATQTFTITQPTALVLNANSQTNISCFGGNNGAASVIPATGGSGGYTYNWTPGNPTGDGTVSVTGLIAGTWTCTVTDANSCTTTRTFNITQPTAIVVNPFSQTNVACFGGSNGAASITTPTGGAGGYTYNWTPGNPTGDGTVSVTGLIAGTWTCTVTDANSCTATQTFNITQPSAIVVTPASQTNISCFGGSNGAATINTPTGGAGGYTYNWTPGNPTGDGTVSVTGLTVGTWTCTVTDANSCTATQTFNITQPTAIVVNPSSQTNVACFGGSNGAASITTPTGGAGGYTYNWTPGNPTGDGTVSVTGLTVGTWTCTVTDANSCTTTQTFNITQPTAIVVTPASQTNISCNGGSNGAASINTPTGGAGGYTYNWTPGNPTGDGTVSVTGLTVGTWTCTVTDANSCTATQTFNITQPTAIVVAPASQTNISCNGGSNGTASITTPTGGAGGYTYNWTPGNPTGDGTVSVTGLIAGTWTCTVTDANSCTTTQTFNITQPTAIVVAPASQTNISCNGGSNGTASITTPTGGAGGYTYNWTPGNPTGDGTVSVTGLTVGTWTCTVTDANSCTTTQTFNITQPTAIVVTPASQTNISCNGGSNGAASINTPTGGAGGYTYNWTPGNPTGDGTVSVTGLTVGTWTCTVTDANSCTTTQTFNITQPTAIDATVSLNGITLTANQAGATYQWFTCPSSNIFGAMSQSYTPTVSGNYGVIVTVGNCSVTSSCTNVLSNLSFETSPTFVVYPNPSNGMINIESNFEGEFQLVNQLGQKIKEFRIFSSVINEVDFGILSDGVYYIIGVNGTKIKSQKLIIKN